MREKRCRSVSMWKPTLRDDELIFDESKEAKIGRMLKNEVHIRNQICLLYRTDSKVLGCYEENKKLL